MAQPRLQLERGLQSPTERDITQRATATVTSTPQVRDPSSVKASATDIEAIAARFDTR